MRPCILIRFQFVSLVNFTIFIWLLCLSFTSPLFCSINFLKEPDNCMFFYNIMLQFGKNKLTIHSRFCININYCILAGKKYIFKCKMISIPYKNVFCKLHRLGSPVYILIMPNALLFSKFIVPNLNASS